jgi:outer membrane murein-binding lipoprotein Lpp
VKPFSQLRRLLAVGAAMAAALVALSGCSDTQLKSGAAVIVDDQRTTIASLQGKVDAITAERARTSQDPVPAAEQSRTQIQRIIVHRILQRAAVAHGVTVSETEIDDRIAGLEQQFGGKEGFAVQVAAANIAPGDLRTFINDELLGKKLGDTLVPGAQTDAELQQRQRALNDLLIQEAKQTDVAVNPRYGSFDPSTGQLSEPTNPLIQRQSPTPSPSADQATPPGEG